MDHKTLVLLVLLRNGAISINELRRLVDLGEIKGGYRIPEKNSRAILTEDDKNNNLKDFDNSAFIQCLLDLDRNAHS